MSTATMKASPEITRAAERYLEQYGDPLVMNTYLKVTILALVIVCLPPGVLPLACCANQRCRSLSFLPELHDGGTTTQQHRAVVPSRKQNSRVGIGKSTQSPQTIRCARAWASPPCGSIAKDREFSWGQADVAGPTTVSRRIPVAASCS